jgi:dihydrofolate reductase
MRQLIVSEFLTLDGVVEAPGGETSHRHAGWTMPYAADDLFAFKLQETRDADSLLLGRRTFDQFVQAWPPREGEFAEKMNAMPKTVVTTRTDDLGWNATRLDTARGVRHGIAALKEGEGGPILVAGSATLARSLLVWGLVDELRLLVYPVLVGGGARIFPDDRSKWTYELAGLQRFSSDAVLHVYRLARS